MASCPVCGTQVRLMLRGVEPWRCRSCRSLLQLGDRPDAAHPLLIPFLLMLPFLRDLVVVECAPDYCIKCYYNLTGNTSGRCPECGTRIPQQHPPAGE